MWHINKTVLKYVVHIKYTIWLFAWNDYDNGLNTETLIMDYKIWQCFHSAWYGKKRNIQSNNSNNHSSSSSSNGDGDNDDSDDDNNESVNSDDYNK